MSADRNPEYKPGDSVWRARDGHTVRYRPSTHAHDTADGRKFRTGQCIAANSNNATFKLLLEACIVGERIVPRSLCPGVSLGDPVSVRVSGSGADDYVVEEVFDARPNGPGDDVAARLARGEFYPGLLPDSCFV